MAYNFSTFATRLTDIKEWLSKELASIRTGQATISLLDSVRVDAYGTKTPLNQCASIAIEDPKTIRITPWDKSLIGAIEKGITVSDLGVSAATDDAGIRVIFPPLTSETRQRLVKQMKAKVEEAKISIRNERSKVSNDIQDKQKGGELSEDEAKRAKDEMQKHVDDIVKKFDEMEKGKEQELTTN